MRLRRHDPCGYCGTKVRPKYSAGFTSGGKKARRQHPTQFVCDKGHTSYRSDKQ